MSGGEHRVPTIIDVAREAGVSRQTVTRALNGLPDVSPATRDRVVAVAQRLRYRPNRAAQGLVRGRSIAIGFVVADLRNPYYPELASALSQQAAERGWSVILCDHADQPGVSSAALTVVAQMADVLVGHFEVDDPEVDRILGSIPRVALNSAPSERAQASVDTDYEPGIRRAIEHLVSTGRTRIAMLDAGGMPSIRRVLYRRIVAEHGLPADLEVSAPATLEGGSAAAAPLTAIAPDAVLVFNDLMAVGLLKGLARLGVSVPGDCAVIGIDGLDIDELVTPELTSLVVDKAEIASLALELIDLMLAGDTSGGMHRTVSHTLVVRESA